MPSTQERRVLNKRHEQVKLPGFKLPLKRENLTSTLRGAQISIRRGNSIRTMRSITPIALLWLSDLTESKFRSLSLMPQGFSDSTRFRPEGSL